MTKHLVRAALAAAVGILTAMIPSDVYADAEVKIHWNDTRQVIDGFGVSQPGDLARYLAQDLAEPQRNEILDLAFSQGAGIGLTIFRSSVPVSLEASDDIWNYTDPHQVALKKAAAQRGPVKLIATVWSPPAWMKTDGRTSSGVCSHNNSPCGVETCGPGNICLPRTSALKLASYQDYADYLVHYAKHYSAANGVDLYAISFANEPDTAQTWESCGWYGDWIATFLSHYLAPAFSANQLSTKVISPEASNWDFVEEVSPPDPFAPEPQPPQPFPLLHQTYKTPTALARLDIAAGHLYGGNGAKPFSRARDLGKKIWQTEASLRHAVFNDEVTGDPPTAMCRGIQSGRITCGTLKWAKEIHDALTGGRVSGWLFWLLSNWRDAQALIEMNVITDTYSVSKTFWAIGHYSKFIRPGFVRIGTSVTGPTDFYVSVFKDPATRRFVVVALNMNASPVKVRFRPQGFSAGAVNQYVTSQSQDLARVGVVSLTSLLTIPGNSIVTFAPNQSEVFWRGTDGAVSAWLVTNGAAQSRFWTGTPDVNWTIQGVGDFDGDKFSDLYWRCTGLSCPPAAHGQLAIWYRGQKTRPLPSFPGRVADDGWVIRGVGDFDGNARSDVLWQYVGPTNHGQLAIWYDGQSSSPSPSYPGIVGDDGWRVSRLGDFDGDGRSDILWRYYGAITHGQISIWWGGQNSSPTPTYAGLVSDDTRVISGVGDFDGNFRDDILWRYTGPSNHGRLEVWWNGQNVSPVPTVTGTVPDDNWVIKGIENFNGDSKSDVLWQYFGQSGQTTRGQIAIWFGAQSTNPAPAFPAVVPDTLTYQGVGKSGL